MAINLDASAQQFLFDIDRIRQRADKAQREISSGYRVNRPSDDPGQLPSLLGAQAALQRNEQAGKNLELVRAETDAAEHAVGTAVKVLDRVLTLASRAANTTATTESRAAAAVEVQGLIEQLVALANTSSGGRYLFAGDTDQTPPYQVDLAAPNGVSPFAGAPSTRQIEDAQGTRFAVARTAQEIFDSPSAVNVFATVNTLRLALEANDQAAVAATLPDIREASSHLNRQLSFYGFAQTRVREAITVAHQERVLLQQETSRLRDADVVEAAIELAQAQTHQEAAFTARARRPQSSLFDYLG